jgi:hypothetical protein
MRVIGLAVVLALTVLAPFVAEGQQARKASRLRRMLRLHRDLGVNLTGAAIIVAARSRAGRSRRVTAGAMTDNAVQAAGRRGAGAPPAEACLQRERRRWISTD